ncbi:hypothetical protein B0H14DRAFT_3496673 [Mycena olivaceomarginata]|nr:hypothetical protein B0H14DRAFT_3496673 [Mycena olivaceomarginata]
MLIVHRAAICVQAIPVRFELLFAHLPGYRLRNLPFIVALNLRQPPFPRRYLEKVENPTRKRISLSALSGSRHHNRRLRPQRSPSSGSPLCLHLLCDVSRTTHPTAHLILRWTVSPPKIDQLAPVTALAALLDDTTYERHAEPNIRGVHWASNGNLVIHIRAPYTASQLAAVHGDTVIDIVKRECEESHGPAVLKVDSPLVHRYEALFGIPIYDAKTTSSGLTRDTIQADYESTRNGVLTQTLPQREVSSDHRLG